MPPDDSATRNALPGGAFLKRMIFRVTIMFMALTSLCLFLRLWAKLRIGKRKLVVDDYSMLTAWFFYMLLSSLALNAALLEHHNPILTLAVADKFLLLLTLGEVMFMLSTIFLKISLMLFYKQFLWKEWQRRAIVIAGGCSIILSAVALFLSLFQCGALEHIAYRQVNGKCLRRNKLVPLLYLHGATGAVTDWAFALLPVSVLIKSSLKPHIKLSVCILLTLGVAGSVAACFRTAYVYGVWFNVAFLDQSAHISFYDHSAPEIVLALTELGFGISAASLACLQPLFRLLVHKTRDWIQTWFSDDSNKTIVATRSHVGLLPHFELRGRKAMGAVSKQPRAEACEVPSPEFPPHTAVRRHGIRDGSDGPSSARVVSLSGHRSSQSVLPMLGVVEAGGQPEQRKLIRQQRKPSLIIGVLPTLPTIATEIGTEEEEFGPRQVVADTAIQVTFQMDDNDRILKTGS